MNFNPLEQIISILSPEQCHLCSRDAIMLCDECSSLLIENKESRCYICNKITVQNQICPSCISNSRLRRIWWLGLYDKDLKHFIGEMKFHRKRAYARRFGELFAGTVPYLADDTLVIPAPTASRRIRQRSFDQAVIIARSFAAHRSLKALPRLLQRRNQDDQIGKRRADRIHQMKDSFVVSNPSAIYGRSILLVDDVVTTGATLESAAAILRKHGAKHVDAVVIARSLRQ